MRFDRAPGRPLRAGAHLAAHDLAPTLLGIAVSVLVGLVCLVPAGSGAAPAAGTSRYQSSHARAGAARGQHRLVGVGDQQASMFASKLWKQLHTRIVRLVVPYDAAVRPGSLAHAAAWIQTAEAEHQQILVAFYHSQRTPSKLPSVHLFQRDVRRFVKLFPRVHLYQSWDEANRGSVRGRFSSPSAQTAARYYQALKRACPKCTVAGLDVLDANNPNSTLRYIEQFKHAIRRLKAVMPKIWGVHNYADVNRLEGWRTRKVDDALGGEIWLTETGGIVHFGSEFPNRHGSGLRRAARALHFALRLAASQRQIKRVYVYDWSGASDATPFDAGLTDRSGRPRPAYLILCRHLIGGSRGCRVAVSQR